MTSRGVVSRVPLPLNALLDRLKLAGTAPTVQESLHRVTVHPQVIQDFRPLSQSLEWELSALHWATAGVFPFVENEVPFIINNSGLASENTAATLFANCLEAKPQEERIAVLELGAGTGLFARYFLSAFRTICEQEGGDYYSRLVYFVSDRSRRSVEQWQERTLFEGHTGHFIIGTCDAANPTEFRNLRGEAVELPLLRAVICNYVLDVLPSAVVRRGSAGCEQLCVRTHLTENLALVRQYTRLTIDEIRVLANTEDHAERSKLIPLLTLFEFESAFQPVGDDRPPYMEEALALGKGVDRVLLSYGTIDCLEKCLKILHPEGFVLINDYGPVQPDQLAEHASAQRFGSTTALGINFPLLEHHFSQRGLRVTRPEGDDSRAIHSRLISRADLPQTREAFDHRFSAQTYRYFEAPIEEARGHVRTGRRNEALESYRTALARSPRDWHLIGEVAEFVGLHLEDFSAGLDLARAAIELNPSYSAWLWNVLGDCLYCLGRYEDAHEAYSQARRINPDDVRTNLNLAYTDWHFGRYDEALHAIATGLKKDTAGVFRERLLQKQQHVLAALSGQWLGEQERLLKRAAIFAARDGGPGKG